LREEAIVIDDSNIHDLVKKYLHNKGDLPAVLQAKPIGKWNVSRVTNMASLFEKAHRFNESIEEWDVSKVVNMESMFAGAHKFNQPLNGWKEKVHNVKTMKNMFQSCFEFNQPLDKWDVGNVEDMEWMFFSCGEFNKPLANWKVNNVSSMAFMFYDCKEFDQPLGKWEVDGALEISRMFKNAAKFNQDLSKWKLQSTCKVFETLVGTAIEQPFLKWTYWIPHFVQGFGNWKRVIEDEKIESLISKMQQEETETDIETDTDKDTEKIFVIDDSNIHDLVKKYSNNKGALPKALQQKPIGKWDVSRVTNMASLFSKDIYNFNESIEEWDVSNVVNMEYMFKTALSFNQPLNGWKVHNVKTMKGMFTSCTAFDQPLDKWDVGNVEDMEMMFFSCRKFNQPLTKWKVNKVRSMRFMFCDCANFNQPLGEWDVSRVTNISSMFNDAKKFNQDLSEWRLRFECNTRQALFNTAMKQPFEKWTYWIPHFVEGFENSDAVIEDEKIESLIPEMKQKALRQKRRYDLFSPSEQVEKRSDDETMFQTRAVQPVPEANRIKIIKSLNHLNKLGRTARVDYDFLNRDTFRRAFYIYLMEKYGANCINTYTDAFAGLRKYSIISSGHYNLVFEEDRCVDTEDNKHFAKELVECDIKQNKKLIILTVALLFKDNTGHANMIIYRPKQSTIEYFEPHGSAMENKPENREWINKCMTNFIHIMEEEYKLRGKKKKIVFKDSADTCPTLTGEGMQDAERADGYDSGYCVSWSFLFGELVLDNPELSAQQVNAVVFDYANSAEQKANAMVFLKNVVRGFAARWFDKLQKQLGYEGKDLRDIDSRNLEYFDFEAPVLSPRGFSYSPVKEDVTIITDDNKT